MNYAAYYRVSTDRQGQSGLGLEAQQDRVEEYVEAHQGHLVATFRDIMSGRKRTRPGLQEALAFCRETGAVLVVAKLDRIARDVGLIVQIQESKVKTAFLDLNMNTTRPEGELMLYVMAAVAQFEARRIGQRVSEALERSQVRAAAEGRQWNHGASVQSRRDEARRRELVPVLDQLHRLGFRSVRKVAGELNRRGVPGVRGGCWGLETTSRLLRWYRQELLGNIVAVEASNLGAAGRAKADARAGR